METIIVERELPTSVDASQVQAMAGKADWCFTAYRVTRLRSYLSADGKTLVCVFRAPDIESVKQASRKMGVPHKRIYRASVHTAE
jgi:hypothetical protein